MNVEASIAGRARGARVRVRFWLLAAFLATAPCAARAGNVLPLNGPWTRSVNGQSATDVTVPCCFDPIGGQTTYVRRFTLDTSAAGSVALLQFDGVVGQATIWLNDVLLGTHGSYTPFWFEVSQTLRPAGAENVLKVTLDDHRDATTIPYEDIPWVNSCGIIRDVSLRYGLRAAVLRAGVQYTFADAAYSRVDGQVTVDLIGAPRDALVLAGGLFTGPANNLQLVAPSTTPSPVLLDAQGRASTQLQFSLPQPQLWSPDNPQLYTLWFNVTANGAVVDDFGTRTGFRDIAVRGNDVLLNGQPIFLRGICRHDIYADTGFAGTADQMTQDMLRIKQMGANFVRLIHYPQHPQILALADELGLMVSCEIPAWANFFDPAIRTQLYTMYQELIQRDMNHPAVILWLSGNARARPMPYALEAQQLARSLDRNRLASYVIDDDEYDPASVNADAQFVRDAGLDIYLKVTFWLYYLEFLQDAWTNFPKNMPIVIAELGFEGDNRGPVIITPEGDQLNVTEAQQASQISEQLEGWRPHLPFYASEHITGMTIYTWQDLRWPDITRHLPNHIPELRFGMVYEDRQPKQALGTVSNYYLTLPQHFVGSQLDANAPVEAVFAGARDLAVVNTANRDSGPSLNAAGTRLYFASDGPDYVSLPKLMVTELVNGVWQPPQLLDIPQETQFFAFRRAPCISFDEHTLYFTRAILSGIFVAETRIWRSDFLGGHWQQPVDLGDPINYPDPTTITSDPCISLDGNTLYFSSDRPGGYGGTDIWVSQRVNGVWQDPQNLGPVVNSPSNDSEPCISPDGNTLYFSSGRPGGFGSSDIWVTHRINGAWTTPANLGLGVNSTGSEREPELSKDGRYLFFTGIRDGGQGLSDIWYAPVPGAPDFTDLSGALPVQATTNNPGVTFGIIPDDIAFQSSGSANDAPFVRQYRPGTPVGLTVAGVYNGLDFWHWSVNGVVQPDRQTSVLLVVTGPMQAEADYAIPVALSIEGESQLQFKSNNAAAATQGYTATVHYLDNSTKPVRSGVHWSVDNTDVATIDPDTGVLTPQALRGPASVTILADGEFAGFKLPTASMTVQLQVQAAGRPTNTLCGPLGLTFPLSTLAGLGALRGRSAARSWLCGRHGRRGKEL